MLIIGHRGAAGLVEENTVSSLKKAEELGVNMVEMDLRRDKNNKIVLSHDPDPSKKYAQAVSLNDALRVVSIPVNLEVKEQGFEAELLNSIKDFPFEVLISSFKPKVLMKIRALNRDIKLCSLVSPEWKNYFYPLLGLAKLLKIYSIHPHHSLVNAKRVWWMKKMGFKIYPFVINTVDTFESMKNLEVDGVFTDRPDLIKN